MLPKAQRAEKGQLSKIGLSRCRTSNTWCEKGFFQYSASEALENPGGDAARAQGSGDIRWQMPNPFKPQVFLPSML